LAVRIRLKRLGRRKRPFFRVVAIDSRSRRDGAEIERLGWYDPLASADERFLLNEDRIFHWLEVGAQPSKTVKNLFSQAGIGLKWHLKRNGKSPEEIEAAVEEWHNQQLERQRRREALEAQKKRAAKPQAEEAQAAEAEAGIEAESEAGAEEEKAGKEAPQAEKAIAEEAAAEEAPAEDEPQIANEAVTEEKAESPEGEPADKAAPEDADQAAKG